jgi:rfaE bifunctional protein nucleotidyltransferase chain/domain
LGRIVNQSQLLRQLRQDRKKGRSIVFTNGCFDLLHPGHIRTLTYAKSFGDRLVVALNSDASVKTIKGNGRPVLNSRARTKVMAALNMVDYVTVFREETPEQLIKKVRPDILVKGQDWSPHKIIGREFAKKVVRVPLIKGISTTAILEQIRRQACV